MSQGLFKPRRRIMLAVGASAVAGGTALMLFQRGNGAYPQGSPMVVDLADLPDDKLQTVEWQGLPVWIFRRSTAAIATLSEHEAKLADPASQQSLQPAYCRNRHRARRPDVFVAIGLCTHQGCTPALTTGGFLCPCHASRYDLAGRVFKLGPATANLVIPAYHFETENRLLLGADV